MNGRRSTRAVFAASLTLAAISSSPAARAQGAGGSVPTFAANGQHTAVFQVPGAELNAIRWSTKIDLNPTVNAHYGSPVISAGNTIFVPVKTATDGFQVKALNGTSGEERYTTLTTDYIMPAHNWIPIVNPAIATFVDNGAQVTRLYYPGAGGTILFIDNPDASSHTAPARRAFFGIDAYNANAAAFNGSVFINTPITTDSKGNIFFGFRVQGTAPSPLNTTQSGFARLTPNGTGTFVLAAAAANDANVARDTHNSAPALSADESTLYVLVRSASSSVFNYLVGLDATTLQMKYRVFLRDPRNNRVNGASTTDDSTASPTVAPDGDVYFGVLGNPGNGSRGFLLRFSADLATEKTPGAFGWDSTPAIVPSSMVPLYKGSSSYLIFAKYNNYAIADGDGVNRIALLDPNSTQIDPHSSANNLVVMREVLTMISPTPDPSSVSATFPDAVREWCINTAAVNPSTNSIFTPNEDGFMYRWNLQTNSLTQALKLTKGFLEPYVPTVVGPDGSIVTLNGGAVFALGTSGSAAITITSSNADARTVVVGQPITFTARVAGGHDGDSITLRDDVYFSSVFGFTIGLGKATLSNGQATYTTASLGAGTHFIRAAHDTSGASVTFVQKVHRQATTTTTTAVLGSGGSTTIAAAVAGVGGGTPTGMVTFEEGSTVLAQIPLRNGSASFTTTFGGGTHTITATYVSDPTFALSTGSAIVVIPSSH